MPRVALLQGGPSRGHSASQELSIHGPDRQSAWAHRHCLQPTEMVRVWDAVAPGCLAPGHREERCQAVGAGVENSTWLPCHLEAEKTWRHERDRKNEGSVPRCSGQAPSTPDADPVPAS